MHLHLDKGALCGVWVVCLFVCVRWSFSSGTVLYCSWTLLGLGAIGFEDVLFLYKVTLCATARGAVRADNPPT